MKQNRFLISVLAGIVLIVILSGPVFGEVAPTDGNSLLEQCNDAIRIYDGKGLYVPEAGLAKSTFCGGYVTGFIDVNNAHWKVDNLKTNYICPPDQIHPIQIIRVVHKYLKDHPEDLHEYRGILVFRALKQAFPCK